MRWIVTGLIVVIIGVVLAGVLVLAIAHWRANADRARCADNLRRLGKYLIDESTLTKAFPAATLVSADLPPEKRLSWMVAGLGALGYPELASSVELAAPWDSPANRAAAATFLPRLACPALTQMTFGKGYVPTNYPGMAGVGADAASKAVDAPGAGIFRYDQPTPVSDVKDGLANTLMLLETADRPGPWIAGGFPTVRPLVPSMQPFIGSGRPFGGCHVGGANAAFADGSCRLIAYSVSPDVLELLAGIADSTRSADSQ